MLPSSTLPVESAQEQVELFIGCRNLKSSLDTHLLPKVKLYVEKNGQYTYFGETETLHYNDKVDFATTFVLSYFFETNQKLRFDIIHSEQNQETLVGQVPITLGSIVGTRNQTIKNGLDVLLGKNVVGKLIVRFEKVTLNNAEALLQFQAKITDLEEGLLQSLDVFGIFTSKNPVLKLYRITNDDDYSLIYESGMVENSMNPKWEQFNIKVSKLCNSDYYRPIKARVFSRKNHEDTLLGEAHFNLDDIVNQKMKEFALINPTANKKIGTLNLAHYSQKEKNDFLDYLKGGTQLNVIVGIDFTSSNGDPDVIDSFHSIKYDGTLNEYQKAIQGVCSILLDYDYDKRVLMLGFGGKPRFPNYSSNAVQHCFPMNGDPMNPWIFGLDGILNTYSNALQNVVLSGPTLFAPMLHEAMKIAQKNKAEGSVEYTILLIITDGEIHDMEASINCLIKSAQLPLSVIIVGVGSADFNNMKILDGDEGLQNSQGIKAERDLVQFVPFRDFQMNSEELAKHVLEEIPTQLVEYMTSMGIKPNNALYRSFTHAQSHSLEHIMNMDEINQAQGEVEVARDGGISSILGRNNFAPSYRAHSMNDIGLKSFKK